MTSVANPNRRGFNAALLAAAFGGSLSRAALAADATPTPATDASSEEAGHIVVRRWKLAAGVDYAAFTKSVQEGYVPIIQQVEGFVAYYFANPGEGEHMAVSVFATKAGADASTVAAKDWSAANLQGVVEGPPIEVIEAEIWMNATPLGVESKA
ncbi:MAG: hypothetical protein ACR2J8_04280 [Thermomicrobiales bacterium]